MKSTRYFEEQVLRKRPYIQREWCAAVVAAPLRRELQQDGRIRYWGAVLDTRDGKERYIAGRYPGRRRDDPQRILRSGLSARYSKGQIMKLHYYPETDSLYIELKSEPGAETREVADGLNVDLDAKGEVVGFDIDRASRRLDLSTLETIALPVTSPRVA
jgi:uncharacterized protein YuzE